jgi:hypothetical protein
MESKIVELRERGERQLRRAKRTAVIVGGAGAALGLAALTAFVIYRLTRPPTAAERARRLLPSGMTRRLRGRVPPVRLYVGDRQVGEEAPTTGWERIAVRAAQAAGTAAAGTLAARLLAGVGGSLRGRDEDK